MMRGAFSVSLRRFQKNQPRPTGCGTNNQQYRLVVRAGGQQQSGDEEAVLLPKPLRRPRVIFVAPDALEPEAEEERAALQQGNQAEELQKLLHLLPPAVYNELASRPDVDQLIEVVMDLGRPPMARFPMGREIRLSDTAVTYDDLEYATAQVGDFMEDNRAGLDRTLHRISCIRNRKGRIVGLTCRVGRSIRGSASLAADLLPAGVSILLLGRPGSGKTTALREMSRVLADELGRRVVIVDTSNEIGGDGDVPHPGIGKARRMQVPNPAEQHRVMIEAVENHTPQVIVIDEIGTELEALAARTIAQRGVQLVATAHGNFLEDLMKNPSLTDLIGGISSVTLSDEEARRRGVQKSVLERKAPPSFDVCVEMKERGKWVVHLDTGAAVDTLLGGKEPKAETRLLGPDGRVLVSYEDASDRPGTSKSGLPSAGSNPLGLPTFQRASGARPAPLSPEEARQEMLRMLAEARAGDSPAFQGNGDGPSGSGRTGSGGGGGQGAARGGSQGGRQGSASGPPSASAALAVVAALEAAASAERGRVGAATAAKAAATSLAAAAPPPAAASDGPATEPTAVCVYLYGVEEDTVDRVIKGMSIQGMLQVVTDLEEADAVLALRASLKAPAAGDLKANSRALGVPIYALRSATSTALVKAVRTLLGFDPAPGGTFLDPAATGAASDEPPSDDDVDEALLAAMESGSSGLLGQSPGRMGGRGTVRRSRSYLEDAARVVASGRAGAAGTSSRMTEDAMYEARFAIEDIVLVRGQPAELLPRPTEVLDLQAELVRSYRLSYETVGEEGRQRLRILPKGQSTKAERD